MTDRYNAVIVVLDKDIRDDDARPLLSAIQQLKGVISVEGNVASPADHIAQERAQYELKKKMWATLMGTDLP